MPDYRHPPISPFCLQAPAKDPHKPILRRFEMPDGGDDDDDDAGAGAGAGKDELAARLDVDLSRPLKPDEVLPPTHTRVPQQTHSLKCSVLKAHSWCFECTGGLVL